MKKTILRLTLSAVLLIAAATTPAVAQAGPPPPGHDSEPLAPLWVVVALSVIHL